MDQRERRAAKLAREALPPGPIKPPNQPRPWGNTGRTWSPEQRAKMEALAAKARESLAAFKARGCQPLIRR